MAEGRDKQSMGVVTSLTVNPATPYQLNYRGESLGIVRGTGADWFGPLNPLEPTAPPEVKGRSFDIPSGYNLNIRPRAYESITFDQLRAFADGYDLLRTVIETRKDQLARLSWNIVARGADKKRAKDPKIMDQIAKVEKFFVRPDGEHFWDDWLRMVIEDLLVLDAPAIFRRRTFGGNLYALEPIDGGTIKRVIDDWGRTPSAPAPAYQQVLKGFPAVDYTVNDLIYRPRNIRTHKVYGYSPVEQIVMTINIAIRRQVWQLQSFTEGNIPEALIGTPSTWTPDQIRAFQDWFDSLLEGNTGERRRARFVPGEVSKGYVATKPSELFGDAEEWLARIVCFAFNISAQPFVAMMNRATAETAQETAVMDGLAPLQQWVKNLVDTVILDDFGYDDIEFQWLDEDELDPNVKSTILDREVASGMLTMNEARAEKGLDPYDHEDADRPMFKSAQGYVPIYNTPEEEAEAEARVATADAQAAGGEAPPVNAEDVEGTDIAPDADKDSGDGSPVKPQEVAEKSDRPFVESGLTKSDWDEDSHPRDENGRFGSGGGSGERDESAFRMLGREEQEAVQYYRDDYTGNMNVGLREGREPSERVQAIDRAIASSQIEATTVYRGISMSEAKWSVGDTISDKGFASTSEGRDVASNFAVGAWQYDEEGEPLVVDHPALLEISVPDGASALRIPSGESDEKEVLMGRNTQIKITGISETEHTNPDTGETVKVTVYHAELG